MPAVLKTKINASLKQSSASADIPNTQMSLFEPLQNSLCEMLRALTEEEFEPGAVNISALSPPDIPSVVNAAGIKVHFKLAAETEYYGLLSLGLTAQVTRRSLLFSEDQLSLNKDYSPSRLDCLLLQPMAELIGEKTSELFSIEPIPVTKIGLKFQDLGIGKADLKAMGRLAQVKISVEKAITVDAKAKSNKTAKKSKDKKASSDTNTDELFFCLTLPQIMLDNLATAQSSVSTVAAPVIDPTHPWAVHMRQSVNSAHVPVRAVVESCAMTVAECTRLEIGQVISLPGVSLGSVRLFIDMESGPLAKRAPVGLTHGALGIFKKNRALKMNEAVDPDFIQDLNLHTI